MEIYSFFQIYENSITLLFLRIPFNFRQVFNAIDAHRESFIY